MLLHGSIFSPFPSPTIKSSLSVPDWRGSITTRLPIPTDELKAKFCTLCAAKNGAYILPKLWKISGCRRKGNDSCLHEVFSPSQPPDLITRRLRHLPRRLPNTDLTPAHLPEARASQDWEQLLLIKITWAVVRPDISGHPYEYSN